MLEGSAELNRTLDEYVRVAVRRRWWLLLPFSVIALAAAGVSLLLPESYRSEAVILVEQQKVPAEYVVSNISSDQRNRLQTMTQQILSRTRLVQIINEFDLYPRARRRLVSEELVELLRENITIKVEEGKGNARRNHNEVSAFTLSFATEDPHAAQQVTSQLVSLFIQENLKAREQQSLGTTKFLEDEVVEARKRLQVQEERLRQFKMRYLGELPAQEDSNLQILSGLQMQLQNNTTTLNRAREKHVYTESLLTQYQSRGQSEEAGKELSRLRKERAALLARYTPKHPDVLKIEQEIPQAESLLAPLSEEREEGESAGSAGKAEVVTDKQLATDIIKLKSQLDSNQKEIDNLVKEEKRIHEKISQIERRLKLTPLREQQLADVIRDYSLMKENYEELSKKKLESELAAEMERRQQGEQFRILDPASLPVNPDSPNHLRVSLAGAGLGLGLGLVVAFIVELRDRSLQTEKDLARLFPSALVVGVPKLLTGGEKRRLWWRQLGEWVAGSLLVLAVLAGEFFIFWRG